MNNEAGAKWSFLPHVCTHILFGSLSGERAREREAKYTKWE
jgi:hypothetical protein